MMERKIYTNGVEKDSQLSKKTGSLRRPQNSSVGENECLEMYLEEIGRNKDGFLNNRENGKKVLIGELALVQLKRLEESGKLFLKTGENVKDFLSSITADNLISSIEISKLSAQKANRKENDGISRTARVLEQAENEVKEIIENSNTTNFSAIVKEKMKVAQEGILAYESLVGDNLRLAFDVAKKYQGRGLSLLELVSFANEGLMRAAAKYNWETGYEFSTYSTWWIKQCVIRGLSETGSHIRLPEHAFSALRQAQKVKEELEARYERTPTPDEIAEAAGLDATFYKAMVRTRNVDSLNRPVVYMEDVDMELGDTIAVEENLTDAHRLTIKSITQEGVKQIMNQTLTKKEYEVLELRFGMGEDGRPRTLDEVGKVFRVSRERIRQIESKALRKLKDPEVRRRLEVYF